MDLATLVFRDFTPDDAVSVVVLWKACGLTRPWNDPRKDIARKMTDRNGAFWVVAHSGEIVASVMIGYDGHRGSINYLAVMPEAQAKGLGGELMRRAETYLIDLGCPKVSFCVRKDNLPVLSFYDQLGYDIDDVHFLGKRLIPDD
jgi:ribosomal protein S18 acetylase RimI-like enzyme